MATETKGQVESEEGQAEDSESQVEEISLKTEVEEEGEAEVPKGDETEVSEVEGEEKEPGKVYTESDFNEKLKKEYSDWQSKKYTPLSKENASLKEQLSEAQLKLSEKADEIDLKRLRLYDESELGEEDAARTDEARKRMSKRLRDYEQNSAKVAAREKAIAGKEQKLSKVTEFEKELEVDDITEHIEFLVNTRKSQIAFEDLMSIYNPSVNEEMQKNLKRLNSASTPEHYNDILKTIKAEVKRTSGKQVFDKGRSGGPTGKTEQQIMDDYIENPRNPAYAKAYEELMRRKGQS